jgi:pilus assembly protein Flp/PilA
MKALFARLVREDNGQDLIEYALLAALIALAATVAIGGVGTKLNTLFVAVKDAIPPTVAP